jgi:hypothetical protein
MANSVGSLVARLGLDAADFTAGLSKSEAQAQRFAQNLDRTIAAGIIKAEVAMRAFATTTRVAFEVFQSVTSGAAVFKDLEESSGAAAERIASLAPAAATAGVEITGVTDAMGQLTKRLVGVDDESKAAGAALKSIGLEVADIKRLDPVGQYEAIGSALAGFADGAEKVAVAQALFGKQGAEQLRVFAALQEAGGRQVILTQQQIEAADAYADAQTKAAAELKLYAQAAFTQALPALTDLANVAIDVAREFLGVDKATGQLAANNGVKQFADDAVDALAFVVDQVDLVVRLFQLTGKTIAGVAGVYAAVAKGDFAAAREIGKAAQADLDAVWNRVTFTERLATQRARRAAAAAEPPRFSDAGFEAARRPRIAFGGAVRAGSGGGSSQRQAREADDAERYLETLRKQVAGTKELTEFEKVLAEVQGGRLAKATPAQRAEAEALAVQLDVHREYEASLKASKEAADEWIKRQTDMADAARRAVAEIDADNQALREEIEIIAGGETARRAIEQARVSSAIATREEARALREKDGASQSELANLDAEIQKLRERQGLLGQRNTAIDEARALDEQLRKTEQIAYDVSASFEDAFVQFASGAMSAKDAFKAFAGDVIAQMLRISAQQVAMAALGTSTASTGGSGGGWLNALIGGIASYYGGSSSMTVDPSGYGITSGGNSLAGYGLGGGRAIGGPTMPWTIHPIAERQPEVYSDGSRSWLITGSQRGRVDANPRIGGGTTINAPISITVPGSTSRRTATQIGAEVSRALAVAGQRNN